MTSIDRDLTVPGSGRAARQASAYPRTTLWSIVARTARAWRSGSGCIPQGLFCSLLTCLASVGVNLFIDGGGAFPAALYLRKLATGYGAAASVVVIVFPLLPALARRKRSTKRPQPPG